jgi:hypothetical protein
VTSCSERLSPNSEFLHSSRYRFDVLHRPFAKPLHRMSEHTAGNTAYVMVCRSNGINMRKVLQKIATYTT